MNKKQIIGIVLAAVGVVGLFGIASSKDATALIIGSVVLIGAGIVVFALGLKKPAPAPDLAAEEPKAASKPVYTAAPAKPAAADGSKEVDMLPVSQGEMLKIYQYKEKVCVLKDQESPLSYIQSKANDGKRQLSFEFEPENEFDSDAVAILLDGKKIGYVYRGQTQDMIHDYHRRGFEVCAHINTFDESGITYKIGFYKPKSECKTKEIPYKNVKFSENHYEGEMLEAEYDSFDECFKIYSGDEEYKLPQSAEGYANQFHSVPVEVGENAESLIFYK